MPLFFQITLASLHLKLKYKCLEGLLIYFSTLQIYCGILKFKCYHWHLNIYSEKSFELDV